MGERPLRWRRPAGALEPALSSGREAMAELSLRDGRSSPRERLGQCLGAQGTGQAAWSRGQGECPSAARLLEELSPACTTELSSEKQGADHLMDSEAQITPRWAWWPLLERTGPSGGGEGPGAPSWQ